MQGLHEDDKITSTSDDTTTLEETTDDGDDDDDYVRDIGSHGPSRKCTFGKSHTMEIAMDTKEQQKRRKVNNNDDGNNSSEEGISFYFISSKGLLHPAVLDVEFGKRRL